MVMDKLAQADQYLPSPHPASGPAVILPMKYHLLHNTSQMQTFKQNVKSPWQCTGMNLMQAYEEFQKKFISANRIIPSLVQI